MTPQQEAEMGRQMLEMVRQERHYRKAFRQNIQTGLKQEYVADRRQRMLEFLGENGPTDIAVLHELNAPEKAHDDVRNLQAMGLIRRVSLGVYALSEAE
ncbi:hypothetical protein [Ruegeria sp. HKCCD6109]|uniref:hypothetical protein n=1 Tax=Ruegeria sp. HKCCD6109 TaxID=2683017 RepID=UPI00149224EB|nr:hypothetical protein [Ruegeria sp. HKCCD6109]NOD65798.1 hypothetical protein [Ruegeria sp. HKCCD6109]